MIGILVDEKGAMSVDSGDSREGNRWLCRMTGRCYDCGGIRDHGNAGWFDNHSLRVMGYKYLGNARKHTKTYISSRSTLLRSDVRRIKDIKSSPH